MSTVTKKIEDYLHLYLGCEVHQKGGHPIKLRPDHLGNSSFTDGLSKIVLRPLSDMTEEEKTECYKKVEPYQGHVFEQARFTKYMLSKHFDLFGLIESGLAIDKTTLK